MTCYIKNVPQLRALFTRVGLLQTQFFEHEADTLQQMRDSIKPNCTPMGNSLDGLHVYTDGPHL